MSIFKGMIVGLLWGGIIGVVLAVVLSLAMSDPADRMAEGAAMPDLLSEDAPSSPEVADLEESADGPEVPPVLADELARLAGPSVPDPDLNPASPGPISSEEVPVSRQTPGALAEQAAPQGAATSVSGPALRPVTPSLATLGTQDLPDSVAELPAARIVVAEASGVAHPAVPTAPRAQVLPNPFSGAGTPTDQDPDAPDSAVVAWLEGPLVPALPEGDGVAISVASSAPPSVARTVNPNAPAAPTLPGVETPEPVAVSAPLTEPVLTEIELSRVPTINPELPDVATLWAEASVTRAPVIASASPAFDGFPQVATEVVRALPRIAPSDPMERLQTSAGMPGFSAPWMPAMATDPTLVQLAIDPPVLPADPTAPVVSETVPAWTEPTTEAPQAQTDTPDSFAPAEGTVGIGVPAPSGLGLPQLGRFGIEDEGEEEAGEAQPVEDTLPALERFAAEFFADDPRALLAVVLLAQPGDAVDVAALAALPMPVSIALDPSDPASAELAEELRGEGLELVVQIGELDGDLAQAMGALPQTVALIDGAEGQLQSDRDALDLVLAQMAQSGHGLLVYPRGFNTAERMAAQQNLPAITLFRDLSGVDAAEMGRILDRAGLTASLEGGVVLAAPLREDVLASLVAWSLGDRSEAVAIAPVSAVLMRR